MPRYVGYDIGFNRFLTPISQSVSSRMIRGLYAYTERMEFNSAYLITFSIFKHIYTTPRYVFLEKHASDIECENIPELARRRLHSRRAYSVTAPTNSCMQIIEFPIY